MASLTLYGFATEDGYAGHPVKITADLTMRGDYLLREYRAGYPVADAKPPFHGITLSDTRFMPRFWTKAELLEWFDRHYALTYSAALRRNAEVQ